MLNRRSNHWLNTIPTLFDLGQGVHFWAGKILGLRKSLKNVTSPSITDKLAQDVSSNYEPCASTVPFQAQCNPHGFEGPAALVLSAF